MSQENLELMRRGYEHFGSTGDFLVEIMHPDFVWNMSTFRGWPERQTYSGIDGLREFNSDWTGAWEDWDLEVKALRDAGDKVLAIVYQRGRSKGTGITIDMEFAHLWTVREGKVVRLDRYATVAEALEAVAAAGVG